MNQRPSKPSLKDLQQIAPNPRVLKALSDLFDMVPDAFNENDIEIQNAVNTAQNALSQVNNVNPLLRLLSQEIEGTNNLAQSALSSANSLAGQLKKLPKNYPQYVIVASKLDLPKAIAGVITLTANYTYFFIDHVDLDGDRLVCGANTSIYGTSQENASIKSTGLALGTALISSEWTMPLKFISLEAATILNLDATANAGQALDWFAVNFRNSGDIGLIKNYSNFIGNTLGLLNSCGLKFDGTIGTVGIVDTILTTQTTGTGFIFPATLTITRRIRFFTCAFVSIGSATAVSLDASAIVPVEGYIYFYCNFSGGGTYLSGVQFDDNKSRFDENRGIENSASIGGFYVTNNETATTLTVDTPTKALGATTAANFTQRFTYPVDNRAVYAGQVSRNFKIGCTASISNQTGDQVTLLIAKNGTEIPESRALGTAGNNNRAENLFSQTITTLDDGDFIEIFIENRSDNSDLTLTDANLIIEAIT